MDVVSKYIILWACAKSGDGEGIECVDEESARTHSEIAVCESMVVVMVWWCSSEFVNG